MSENGLISCPFCGKVPRVKYPDQDGGCTLLHICKFVFNPTFATPEEAAKEWNNRAASPWMADQYHLEGGRIVAVVIGGTKYVKEACQNTDEKEMLKALGSSGVYALEAIKNASHGYML